MKPDLRTWLAWGVLAVALLVLAFQLQPDKNLEPGSRSDVSGQR